MSEMIERVAKAIGEMPWEGREPLNIHDDAEAIARVAVAAMRDPTGDMIDEGAGAIGGFIDGGSAWEATPIAWSAMIDAALAEPTEKPRENSPLSLSTTPSSR